MGENENEEMLGKSDMDTGIKEKDLTAYVKQMLQVLGRPDRLYKDQVFRMLLKNRVVALEVYNAINDSHYKDPEELQITTLENAVYLGMKNDVSFLIDSRLVLYEHQSTYNPNMPLRDLLYVACLFSALICEKNIYGSKLIHLPSPQFVVFYNGIEELPERSVMRLSDAYECVEDKEDIALELKVEIININYGKNQSLMEKSPTLAQYAIFVDTVRKYERHYERTEALELAIDECIREGILEDFLRKNRAEVLMLCLFEYDQEKHMKDTYEEGVEDGERRMACLSEKLAEQNRIDDLVRATKDAEYREKLYLEMQIN